MIQVIFEVEMPADKLPQYLALAAELKQALPTMPGFISSERFTSITNPEKLLSLSFWEDEESLAKWRNFADHRLKQQLGRDEIFSHYQITVTKALRQYTESNRQEAPSDSNAYFHLPQA